MAVLMILHEICHTPIITRENFRIHENKAVLLKQLEILNCPYYYELKFSQKQVSFGEPIRKFELPLLWWASIFSKIREFLWYHLKIWTAPIITSWNIKSIPFLMKSFEYLNCPMIMRHNCIKCKAVLMMSLSLTPSIFPYYHKVKFPLK